MGMTGAIIDDFTKDLLRKFLPCLHSSASSMIVPPSMILS